MPILPCELGPCAFQDWKKRYLRANLNQSTTRNRPMMDRTRLMFTGAEVLRQPASLFRALSPDYFTLTCRPIASVPAA